MESREILAAIAALSLRITKCSAERASIVEIDQLLSLKEAWVTHARSLLHAKRDLRGPCNSGNVVTQRLQQANSVIACTSALEAVHPLLLAELKKEPVGSEIATLVGALLISLDNA